MDAAAGLGGSPAAGPAADSGSQVAETAAAAATSAAGDASRAGASGAAAAIGGTRSGLAAGLVLGGCSCAVRVLGMAERGAVIINTAATAAAADQVEEVIGITGQLKVITDAIDGCAYSCLHKEPSSPRSLALAAVVSLEFLATVPELVEGGGAAPEMALVG